MPKQKIFLCAACCGLAMILAKAGIAGESVSSDEPKIYKIPTDVTCQKKNNLTYCLDNDGKPITGEMVKYRKGIVIRRYRMENGYLNGIGESYDNNGYLLQKLPYKNGKLNGNMQFYGRQGKLPTEISYVDGKKEGPATDVDENTLMRATYSNDKMNGKWQIEDNRTGETIYELDMVNDELVSGVYYHYNRQADKRCCEPDDPKECETNPDAACCKEVPLVKENIEEIVAEGVNKNCLEIRQRQPLSCKSNPSLETEENDKFCEQWLKTDKDYLSYKKERIKIEKDIRDSLVAGKRHLL